MEQTSKAPSNPTEENDVKDTDPKVSQLAKYHFEKSLIEDALKYTNGDVQKSLALLLAVL